MILIVFAHPAEAQPSIQALAAKRVEHNFYQFHAGNIFICGMGSKNAATIEPLLASHSIVWNLGLVGALSPLPLGTLNTISAVQTDDLPPLSMKSTGWRLYTVATPLHDPIARDQLAASADVVDMEGHTIAHLAKKHQKPCYMWKVVSDAADHKTSSTIHQNIDRLATTLATTLQQNLPPL